LIPGRAAISAVRTVVAVLAACSFSGCTRAPCRPSSAPPRVAAPVPPARPAEAPRVARGPVAPASGTILDHRDGRPIAFDALVARIGDASVVYVGESHDQRAHHEFQRRVLDALSVRRDRPVALGLEMFALPQQGHLDAFLRGEIDEEELRERSEWGKRWGSGWETYRPLLSLARERGVALVALNAPRETTRKVARGGLESLSEEERAALPTLDLRDEAHRRFVREAFGAHGASMKEATFERFYAAQVIWDETMADSVARWLASEGPRARMVVVAGNGHVADRFGIPKRAARRTGRPYVTIVQEVVGGREEPPRLDPGYADFSAWWAPSGAPPRSPAKEASEPAPAPKQP
jgi:uncharacterized iron-regulated protein